MKKFDPKISEGDWKRGEKVGWDTDTVSIDECVLQMKNIEDAKAIAAVPGLLDVLNAARVVCDNTRDISSMEDDVLNLRNAIKKLDEAHGEEAV